MGGRSTCDLIGLTFISTSYGWIIMPKMVPGIRRVLPWKYRSTFGHVIFRFTRGIKRLCPFGERFTSGKNDTICFKPGWIIWIEEVLGWRVVIGVGTLTMSGKVVDTVKKMLMLYTYKRSYRIGKFKLTYCRVLDYYTKIYKVNIVLATFSLFSLKTPHMSPDEM